MSDEKKTHETRCKDCGTLISQEMYYKYGRCQNCVQKQEIKEKERER
jgi:DNA-directed RNA polymerase subunit RPC12/RpoP